ncbi:MAG: ribonuclease E/G [Neisseriaceae bacterium]
MLKKIIVYLRPLYKSKSVKELYKKSFMPDSETVLSDNEHTKNTDVEYIILGYNSNGDIEYLLQDSSINLNSESIYIARVENVNYKNHTAFVNFGVSTGFINFDRIQKLQPGSMICCQTRHLSDGIKQVKLSTAITYIGRYVILTEAKEHIFYCRDVQADKLQAISEKYKNIGIIFRSNINLLNDFSLIENEIAWLLSRQKITDSCKLNKSSIECIHDGMPLYLKFIRDSVFTDDLQIITNDDNVFNQIAYYVDRWDLNELNLDKNYIPKLDLDKESDVIKKVNFSLEFNKISGINLIDINSSNSKLPFFKVNYLALDEIVRQIKLRDLTGIILLDLIKNMSHSERQVITDRLEILMKNDWRNNKILGFTKAGIFEIIRHR